MALFVVVFKRIVSYMYGDTFTHTCKQNIQNNPTILTQWNLYLMHLFIRMFHAGGLDW